MDDMGVVCFDTCSPACVSNRQAGEPAKKRELLKVMERVAMWQALESETGGKSGLLAMCPKEFWPPKRGYFEDLYAPAIEVQTLRWEGPMIHRVNSLIQIVRKQLESSPAFQWQW